MMSRKDPRRPPQIFAPSDCTYWVKLIGCSATTASQFVAPVLEMLKRRIVGAVIVETVAVENRHHQPDAKGVGKADAKNEGRHPACAQSPKTAKDICPEDRQDRQPDRSAHDPDRSERPGAWR